MGRETRIELATNSLEGCDSTIELLPRLPKKPAHENDVCWRYAANITQGLSLFLY